VRIAQVPEVVEERLDHRQDRLRRSVVEPLLWLLKNKTDFMVHGYSLLTRQPSGIRS
jgi:hypothetical protein